MEALKNVVFSVGQDLQRKERLQSRAEKLTQELESATVQLDVQLEAQKLLGTVADEQANRTLDYVTGIINKALAEVFPNESKRIKLERRMLGGKHPQIDVVLLTDEGKARDLVTQSGTGLRQIVSFLYRLCLLEITGARKLIMMDELLSGVHKDAAVILEDMIRIFAKGGFQFIIVDYALAEEMGLTYLVEGRAPGHSIIRPLDTEDEAAEYNVNSNDADEND